MPWVQAYAIMNFFSSTRLRAAGCDSAICSNVYRGTADAFQLDHKALSWAKHMQVSMVNGCDPHKGVLRHG